MYRIDDATAATSLPVPEAAGTEGYFTEGNPATGTPATKVRGSWLNMIQEELRNVVTGGGLTPSKTTYTQVLSAIKRICQNTIVLADTGAANAYAATNSPPLVAGTWVDGVVQQVKIAHANTGASTYAPDGLTAIPIYGLGLQPLQGGELFLGGTAVLMRATIAGVNSGNPICVLMECAGGAQQVAPATQSQHAVQMGQLYGGLKGIVRFTSAGSWTVPIGVTQIFVSGCAGGGGGGAGGSASGTNGVGGGGGGGGAGQSLVRVAYPVTPGGTVSISAIGAAGNGAAATATGSGSAGGPGGNTVIGGSGFNNGTAVTLTGGGGGGGGVNATNPTSGGATASGGAAGTGFPAGSWGRDVAGTGTSGVGGAGGDAGAGAGSPFGGGGGAARGAQGGGIAGGAAGGFGSGGGGGGGTYTPTSGTGGAGGNGSAGIVIIEW